MKVQCETKSKLLATAMELMWESSYGSVSVDHICKRAGVNKGSFYYFFPSKADLTVASMEEYWQEKQGNLDRIFSPASSVEKRLDDMVAHILAAQKDQKERFGKVCGCPFISLGSELGTQDAKIRAKTEQLIQRSCRYWESLLSDARDEGLIDDGTDVKQLAREIYSFLLGLVMQARVTNSLDPLLSIRSGVHRLLGWKQAAAA